MAKRRIRSRFPLPLSYLLSGSVPDIEFDRPTVGVEREGVHFYPQGGDILLFKLTSQVAFDEGGFTHPAVTDQNELEFGSLFCLYGVESKMRKHKM